MMVKLTCVFLAEGSGKKGVTTAGLGLPEAGGLRGQRARTGGRTDTGHATNEEQGYVKAVLLAIAT